MDLIGSPEAGTRPFGARLALFTESTYRNSANPSPDEISTAGALLGIKGKAVKADPEVADMCDIDVSLTGWPWGEGTFSGSSRPVGPAWRCIFWGRGATRECRRAKGYCWTGPSTKAGLTTAIA